jgi:hypothetical protein
MLHCVRDAGRGDGRLWGVEVMEERALGHFHGGCGSRFTLRIGGGAYPILRQGGDTCVIEAPSGARLRGYADIYEGDKHRAHCLIVLSEPDGDLIRLTYKLRTEVKSAPPADFAPD